MVVRLRYDKAALKKVLELTDCSVVYDFYQKPIFYLI